MSRITLPSFCVLTLCFGLITGAVAANAAAPKSTKPEGFLGTFGNWQAWQSTNDKEPVCYMVMTQKFTPNKKFPRQNAHLMITHRPNEGTTDVVSYNSGYVYKSGVDVTFKLGKASFSLFSDKDTAWARDPKTDHALTRAIRGGSSVTVVGQPAAKQSPEVTDTLNLKGTDQAYRAISTACNVSFEKLAAPAQPAKAAADKDKKKPAGNHKPKQ